MSLDRILEPEVMDSPDEAADYDAMDHSDVNRRFVADLLAAIDAAMINAQGSKPAEPKPTWDLELETGNLDILDLGAGTALIPIELCQRFASCRVMAADAAVSMLELARYNVEVQSLIDRIDLVHVDAKRLPFADAMFDVVMSNSIVHHIPDPASVLAQAVRVVRPGGLLFFRDLLRPGDADELDRLVATYAAGANDHQRRMFAHSLHAALSLPEIRRLVAALGFAENTIQQTSDRHWTWTATASRSSESAAK